MTQDQKLISLFAAIAVVAGGVVSAEVAFGDLPEVAVVERTVPLGSDNRLSLQFVGDTFLGDRVQEEMEQTGYDFPFDRVRPMMTADFSIATAESAITSRVKMWNPGKEYSYASQPPSATAMADAGVDAVTLANNHAFDMGPAGLADTMRHTKAAGMANFGAGPRVGRAEQPLLLHSEIGTVGIVGMGESFGFRAGEEDPGTSVLSLETVQRGADLARAAGADWVIAYAHWGDNYASINRQQRYWAKVFARAGYDMVIGSGPHRSQPIGMVGAMPVFYSLGNFVFTTRGSWEQEGVPGLGLSVVLELSAREKPRLSVRCLVTDNLIVDYQPRPCTPTETQGYLPTLHPDLVMEGDRGVLPCACFSGRRPR